VHHLALPEENAVRDEVLLVYVLPKGARRFYPLREGHLLGCLRPRNPTHLNRNDATKLVLCYKLVLSLGVREGGPIGQQLPIGKVAGRKITMPVCR